MIYSQGHLAGSAVLSTEKVFIRDGKVTFDFTLITEHNEPFEFYMDGVLKGSWNKTTLFGSIIFTTTFRMGYHSFRYVLSRI